MASTGYLTTGAVASTAWSGAVTTTKINTSDDVRAIATGTSYLAATLRNYTFGLPASATINGIEVVAEFSSNTIGGVASLQCSISWNNGSNYTSTKTDTVTGNADTSKTFGGSADTWGRSWTDSEFADGTFLLKIEGKADGASVSCRLDYLTVQVWYTPAGGNTSNFFF